MKPEKLMKVHVGSNVTIPCSSFGVPSPSITWTRPYMAMPIGRSRVSGNGLLIRRVEDADNGIYICKATNSMGEITAMVNVNVRLPFRPPTSKKTGVVFVVDLVHLQHSFVWILKTVFSKTMKI